MDGFNLSQFALVDALFNGPPRPARPVRALLLATTMLRPIHLREWSN